MMSVAEESINALQKEVTVLKQQFASLETAHQKITREYKEHIEKYAALEEKYKILQHALFSRSSEKLSVDERLQAELFNEAELASEMPEEEEEPEVRQPRSEQRKPRGKRKPIPDAIPREEVIHDIPEDEKVCACGESLVRIGEEVSEELEIIPAQIKVIRHIRPKYGCHHCEGSSDETQPPIRIAAPVEQLLPKSRASAGLIAYIITSKYSDALPLYRQEKLFKRIGVEIPRASMARWIIQLSERISPLLDEVDRRIREGPLIQMDETRIQVHKELNRKNSSNSYMWVVRGGIPEKPLIRYAYHPTRNAQIPTDYLSGYRGYVQTDGYEGYASAMKDTEMTHVRCLAHARRKFADAVKGGKKAGAANEFLTIIGHLYRVEKELRGKEFDPAEFVQERKNRTAPYWEKLEAHLEKKMKQVLPSSALGTAIRYTHEALPKIKCYLEQEYLSPDTNAVERAIRPFVIGRKNWLFADTPRGAHASAAWYSLIESAKSAGHEPYRYLRFVLSQLPTIEKSGNWTVLLPKNVSVEQMFLEK